VHAATLQKTDLVQLLCSAGADVNIQNTVSHDYTKALLIRQLSRYCVCLYWKDGSTALFSAVVENNVEIVRALIGHGANTNVQEQVLYVVSCHCA
jgi:ankyrin repeat protein